MCCICTLVDCGSLENPTNGQVDFTETFGGSIADYTCDQGYLLCGAESRICQSNGSWSESPPDCISKSPYSAKFWQGKTLGNQSFLRTTLANLLL